MSRLALILGCDIADEDRLLVAVVYHTTALRGSRYEVPMRVPGLDEGGFDAQSLYTIPAIKLISLRPIAAGSPFTHHASRITHHAPFALLPKSNAGCCRAPKQTCQGPRKSR
jgi:hypothetical protein